MNIMLLRLGCSLQLARDAVMTLQVDDRVLFTRIVGSLLTGEGQYAAEPYLRKDDMGKDVSARGGLRVVSSLPVLPALDKGLQTKLYRKIANLVELDSPAYLRMSTLIGEVNAIIEETAGGLQGDYCLTKEWYIDAYLKGFGFSMVPRDQFSFLENCIYLFGICADLEPDVPVVLVNAKSFFSAKELEELFSQAVFCGIQLLLLESWPDPLSYELERKTVIDQQFLFEV